MCNENQKELKDFIKKMAITKQLNFLIGSGTSMPAMPSMSKFEDKDQEGKTKKYENGNPIIKIDELINDIKVKSEKIIKLKDDNTDEDDLYKERMAFEKGKGQDNDNSKEIEEIQDYLNFYNVLNDYKDFLQSIIDILNISNSRQTPKNVNIFTTNYDLFIEKAVDGKLKNNRFVFNDGANGYFKRILNSSNYNKTVAYKGLNENYLNEIPSISLIKPHGSVNWKQENDDINVLREISKNPFVVKPTGHENEDTFKDNHFFNMLRVFQLELDKPQTVLMVIGFSFQDQHISDMVKRALENPELIVIVFCYKDETANIIKKNLKLKERRNLKFITPKKIGSYENILLSNVTDILKSIENEEVETWNKQKN